MSLTVFQTNLGMMGTNFYLAKDSAGSHAFAVDPGEYTEELEAFLGEHGVKQLDYILLTHGHFDHINGAKRLKENYGGSIVISEIDEQCFSDGDLSLANVFFAPGEPPESADITVCGGDTLPFADEKIKVLHTPGHTKGGVCYLCGGCLFSGDTLFAGTVGRTDFPGGDMNEMLRSVKTLISLPGDCKLYPGHNESSTLEFERHNNIYCKKAEELK